MAFNARFAARMVDKYGPELRAPGRAGVWTDKLVAALVADGKVIDTMAELDDFGPITGYAENDAGDCYIRGKGGKVAAVLKNEIKDAAWNAPWPDDE